VPTDVTCAPSTSTRTRPDAALRLAAGDRRTDPASCAACAPQPSADDRVRADVVRARLSGMTVGRVGHHPDGFDPCAAGAEDLATLGTTLDHVELEAMFDGRTRRDGRG
jgi:hypothetical protein